MRVLPNVPLVESPRETVKHLIDVIKSEHARAFIDLGCGTGKLVISVANRKVYGIGLEINENLVMSAKNLSKSQNKFRYVDFIVADFYNLPFKSNINAVIYMYLYGSVICSLKSELLKCLGENTTVLSLDFPVTFLNIKGVEFIMANGIPRLLFKYKGG